MPLAAVIQQCHCIYNLILKLLKELYKNLPVIDVQGLHDRYYTQVESLEAFFNDLRRSNLKALQNNFIAIPELSTELFMPTKQTELYPDTAMYFSGASAPDFDPAW